MFGNSPKLITISFPESETRVFTASDLIQGSVQVALATEGKEGKLRFVFEDVHVKLRVLQVTTYLTGAGSTAQDYRQQKVELHTQERLLWTAASTPLPQNPSAPPPILEFPFSFQLPGAHLGLPSSFEGGERGNSTNGHDLARVSYFIKVTGHKAGTFKRDERLTAPFIYMPPSITDPLAIPPPLVPPPSADQPTLPPTPPPAPIQQDGWSTTTTEKDYKESLFGKKNKVVVKFSLPNLLSYPRSASIPYYLSILVFAPLSSSFKPPSLTLPSPSELSVLLIRRVHSRAQGAGQKFDQNAGPLLNVADEKRVWYVPHEWRETTDEEGKTERRWAGEIIVAGEFVLGGDATPSFGRKGAEPETEGIGMGLLGCEYYLRLKLPLKGPMNDLDVRKFVRPFVISSAPDVLTEGEGGEQKGASVLWPLFDVPPSYLSLGHDDGDEDEKGEKK